jgi:hypothetical protein
VIYLFMERLKQRFGYGEPAVAPEAGPAVPRAAE